MNQLDRRWLLLPRPCFAWPPLLGGCLTLALTSPSFATASPPRFQAEFMRQPPGQSADAGTVALQTLATERSLVAGRYRIAVSVNFEPFGTHELDVFQPPGGSLQACLNANLLRAANLREEALDSPLPDDDRCLDLPALVPDARADFDPSRLELSLSIPQIALRHDRSQATLQARWDEGINAAFVSYQASAQQYESRNGGRRSSQDIYLNTGLNVAGWRLRSNQALRDDQYGNHRWTRSDTYAQHDLPGLRANITLGETSTRGDVFRAFPFTGVNAASDMDMLSDIEQHYAPVIRGVAQTRAKIEVLHNGYPIYSTYVAPGPYAIDELGVGSSHGELEIVVTEADGQVRRFTQPYSTLSNLLRNGVMRYSLTFGHYNGAEQLDRPGFWEATLARGGAWGTTLYGGLLGSDYYKASALGVARDFADIGALSLDVTHASTDRGATDGQVQGRSVALRYGKSFATGTNLRFAGYRYSTEGYRDFNEAIHERFSSTSWHGNRRSRLEASVYQGIGDGSLSVGLSQEDYWNSNTLRRQYQIQYNTRLGDLGINVFASQALTERGRDSRQIGLSLSLPLDFGSRHNVRFDFMESEGRYNQRATLNGGTTNRRLSYQASLSNDQSQGQTGAFSLAYQGERGSYGAGYTEGGDYRNLSVNASGAVMLHSGGIARGPYLGETSALVHVPEVAGVTVQNSPGSQTDSNGYLIVPYLRPYRLNSLVLQTDDVPPEVLIDNGSQQVVPRRGAVIKAAFETHRVTRMVLTLHQADGRALPFGAQVTNAAGERLAVVGQAGQALVATETDAPQRLGVHWGGETKQACYVEVQPQAMPSQNGYRVQTLACLPPNNSASAEPSAISQEHSL